MKFFTFLLNSHVAVSHYRPMSGQASGKMQDAKDKGQNLLLFQFFPSVFDWPGTFVLLKYRIGSMVTPAAISAKVTSNFIAIQCRFWYRSRGTWGKGLSEKRR
ncbi:MAG: hypothetical protein CEE38_08720 [Planctomycetes bacterium B3_Pla]|nr:MAG: hypothetical protein CEE38_08720 [Planctomycetes bacterium B3_Pla]